MIKKNPPPQLKNYLIYIILFLYLNFKNKKLFQCYIKI